MATRYSMAEAFKVIVDDNDPEAIDDIFRRYGGAARKMLRAICSTNDVAALTELISLVPDHISMQKINKNYRETVAGVDHDDDVPFDDDTTSDEPKPEKAKPKKKQPEKKAASDDDDTPASKYDGKNARELFELCKERGIDVQPRKRATTYKKLLEEYDANQAAKDDPTPVKDDDPDDEDWDI